MPYNWHGSWPTGPAHPTRDCPQLGVPGVLGVLGVLLGVLGMETEQLTCKTTRQP